MLRSLTMLSGAKLLAAKLSGAKLLATALLLAVWTTGPILAEESGSAEGEARGQIESMLAEQADAWNRGDMVAFTSVYADDAVFVSPSGLTQGRQQVLERYQRRYPDAAARGTLSFEVLEIRVAPQVGASAASASMVARWHLAYEDKDDAEGLTLLVFHRAEDGAWQIVQDASM